MKLDFYLSKVALTFAFLIIFVSPAFAIPNPAAVYCDRLGYDYKIADLGWGQQGICIFSTSHGDFCDEWDFYEGICGKEHSSQNMKEQVIENLKSSDSSSGIVTGDFIEPVVAAPSGNSGLPPILDWSGATSGKEATVGVGIKTPIVSDVKDQGECGSCYAFASIGAVESKFKLSKGISVDLSEQELVSCDKSNTGCHGGWNSKALDYIKEKGISIESCFPYYDTEVSCELGSACYKDIGERYYITGHGDEIGKGNIAIKEALAKYGPLVVSVDAKSWSSEARIQVCKRKINGKDTEVNDIVESHAVLLTGYDDKEGVWIIKNSWGATAGHSKDGYFKVKYGNCGLNKYFIFVEDVYISSSKSYPGAYCKAYASNPREDRIIGVELDGNRRDTENYISYEADTEDILAYVAIGRTYTLKVDVLSEVTGSEYLKAWIDYNDDKQFSKVEEIDLGQISATKGIKTSFEKQFTVPLKTKGGSIRMRVYLSRNGPPEACTDSNNGQVKDYTLSTSDAIRDCGPIDADLVMDTDFTSPGTCFRVQSDGITIDCAGHKIVYGSIGTGYAIDTQGHKEITVRNCNVVQMGTSPGSYAVYYRDGSGGGIIENNNIETKSDGSHGIYIKSSDSTKVIGNNITLKGILETHGIYLQGSKNTETRDNILKIRAGNTNYGIYLYGSDSNKIYRNQLSGEIYPKNKKPYSAQYDTLVHLYESSQNGVYENNLKYSSYQGKGISVYKSQSNRIFKNNITCASCNEGISIYFVSSSGNQIENNNLAVSDIKKSFPKDSSIGSGILVEGIHLVASNENNLSGNFLNMSGSKNSKGIFLEHCSNNTLLKNNFSGYSESSSGIYVLGGYNVEGGRSINNSIKENLINLSGNSNTGIYLIKGKNILINNSVFIRGNSSTGIAVNAGEWNILLNNILSLEGIPMRGIFVGWSKNNRLYGNSVAIRMDLPDDNKDPKIDTKGIWLLDSNGELLTGNKLNISGKIPTKKGSIYGIFVDSKNALVNDTILSGKVDLITGFGAISSDNCSFSNNVINLSGNSSIGLVQNKSYHVTVSGTNISVSGPNCTGIVHYQANLSNISGNNVSISCNGALAKIVNSTSSSFSENYFLQENSTAYYPVIYAENSTLYVFEGNNISGNGTGILLKNSTSFNLTKNSFNTSSGYALFIEPSTNKPDYNHSIDETNTEQGKPIYYYFDKNNLEIKDKLDVGQIYVAFCNKPKIKNIENSTDGITLANSDYSEISDCNLTYSGCNVSGLFLINQDNATINDSFINSSCGNTAEVSLWNATNVSFVNTTYADIYFYTKNSYLERLWYMDLSAYRLDKSPLSGVKITVKNNKGAEAVSDFTANDGAIKRRTLVEYNQSGYTGLNPEGKKYYSLYKATAEKEGYEENSGTMLFKSNEDLHFFMSGDCSGQSSCRSDSFCYANKKEYATMNAYDIISEIEENSGSIKNLLGLDISSFDYKGELYKGCLPKALDGYFGKLKIQSQSEDGSLDPFRACNDYKKTGQLPSKFDWRDVEGYNWMTPVKDQYYAASVSEKLDCWVAQCWIYSILGAMEARYKIETIDPDLNLDLSEDYIACCYKRKGLGGGGSSEDAIEFVKEFGVPEGSGFDVFKDNPDEVCEKNLALWKFGDTSSFLSLEGAIDETKEAIVCNGPVSVWSPEWAHFIVVVGYDDNSPTCRESYDKPGCWILKNSFGKVSGDYEGYGKVFHERGYFYLPYSGHALSDLQKPYNLKDINKS